MIPEHRARIAELLQNENLSYRAIARETGYSDWTIRNVARQLDGDPRPMKRHRSAIDDEETSGIAGWGVLIGIAAFLPPFPRTPTARNV